MALREIVTYPDAILRDPTQEITVFDERLQQLAADMLETMYAAPGVGLAAPQIGVSEKLIVLDPQSDDFDGGMALVNPRIVEFSGGVESEEGCLSLPDFTATVERANWVRVEAQDLDGDIIELEAEGFPAVVLQHEIDHLNGVMIIDRIGKIKQRLFVQKFGPERARVPKPENLADFRETPELG